jgi:hypothetical protein
LEDKETQLNDFRKKLDELNKTCISQRILLDEMDILKEKAQTVPLLEDRIKKLETKAEAVTNMRKQLKVTVCTSCLWLQLLEEQNEEHLKRNIEMEEQVNKANSWKVQLEKYKQQVTDLTAQSNASAQTIQQQSNLLNCLT